MDNGKGPSTFTKFYLVTWKNFALFFNKGSIILLVVFLLLPLAAVGLAYIDPNGDDGDFESDVNSEDLANLGNITDE